MATNPLPGYDQWLTDDTPWPTGRRNDDAAFMRGWERDFDATAHVDEDEA